METLTFVGGLITGAFAIYQVFLGYFNKNISEERIKWRERIREISTELVGLVHKAERGDDDKNRCQVLIAELQSRLNPFDENDWKLLEFAERMFGSNESEFSREIAVKQFKCAVSILLKHDWERSKREAGLSYHLDIGRAVNRIEMTSGIYCHRYLLDFSKKKEYVYTKPSLSEFLWQLVKRYWWLVLVLLLICFFQTNDVCMIMTSKLNS
ncbi:hypothetical protein [Moraxella pluranimalium]|uniref:DUF4760 domain-containing protein n=1 Tax=Moraxella pluranimalium TaxID=470453 RepID=A0A1T0CLU1_9GAMM|nr:hypothetical protein [Moraxella pluranimalium]OOS23229.1 hypothetical protein B0680_07860 [Moraxella pluranimalium]